MKIVFVNSSFGIPVEGNTGGAISIREQLSAMRSLGHKVVLIASVLREKNLKIKRKSFRYIYFGVLTLYGILFGWLREIHILLHNVTVYYKIKSRLKGERIDFIYERYSLYGVAGLIMAKRVKAPFILNYESPIVYEMTNFGKIWFPGIALKIENKLLFHADAVVVQTNILKQYLLSRGVDRGKVFAIPNGVNAEKFDPSLCDRNMIRDKYALRDKVVIGLSGNFRPWHGVDVLAEAALLATKERKDLHIFLVGHGQRDIRDYLRNFIRDNNMESHITITGNIPYDEIPLYISAMDITVAPFVKQTISESEFFYGTSLKIFEYMAMEKPIITSRIGEIPLFIRDGENGVLTEPGNPVELKDKILMLVGNEELRNLLGKNARTIAMKYTWEKKAEKTIDVYKQVKAGYSHEMIV